MTTSVTVRDNSFNPADIAVSVGATVTWTWQGSDAHNVTFDPSVAAPSPTQAAGNFQLTMMTAGTYNYVCTIHAGMDGSVTVQ